MKLWKFILLAVSLSILSIIYFPTLADCDVHVPIIHLVPVHVPFNHPWDRDPKWLIPLPKLTPLTETERIQFMRVILKSDGNHNYKVQNKSH